MAIKIALLQIEASERFSAIEAILSDANKSGADYAVLPEICYGGFNYKTLYKRAGQFEEIKERLMQTALKNEMGIITTIAEMENGKTYNSMLFIDKDGLLKKKQRKHFLFSPTNEENYFHPGAVNYNSVKLKDAIFGGGICYELRFPEIFRKQAFDGMQIAIVPAQWPTSRIAHWKSLLQARAIENSCFFVGVNAIGELFHNELGGNSMIVAPNGKILKALGKEKSIATIEIEIEEIYKTRRLMPSFQDAKKEQFYGNN